MTCLDGLLGTSQVWPSKNVHFWIFLSSCQSQLWGGFSPWICCCLFLQFFTCYTMSIRGIIPCNCHSQSPSFSTSCICICICLCFCYPAVKCGPQSIDAIWVNLAQFSLAAAPQSSSQHFTPIHLLPTTPCSSQQTHPQRPRNTQNCQSPLTSKGTTS